VKLLLDVSALVALLWKSHVHHQRAVAWRQGKPLVLCPITELGFIRVSTNPMYNLVMADARQLLADFIRQEQPEFIPADARAWMAYQLRRRAKARIGTWLIWPMPTE
jgi:predicted nucleic acid-binding protein